MSSEIRQSQIDKYCMIWVVLVTRVVKFTEPERVMAVSRACGEVKENCLIGTEFSFCKIKRVLGMDGGEGCIVVWTSLMLLNWANING